MSVHMIGQPEGRSQLVMYSFQVKHILSLVSHLVLFKFFREYLNFCIYFFSIFYIAFEQYLHIVGDAVRNLSLSIAATFLVIFILLGFDLWSALMILVPVLMIMLSMSGVMYLWNIPLNALSLVNLVMVCTIVYNQMQ